MSVFLDVLLVLIFIVTCIMGYVMGFFKYSAFMLKTLATFIIAAVVAMAFSAPTYEAVAKDKIVNAVEQSMEKVDVVGTVEKHLRDRGLPQTVTEQDIRDVFLKDGDVADNLDEVMIRKNIPQQQRTIIRGEFEKYLDKELLLQLIKQSKVETNGKENILKVGVDNSRAELVKFIRLLLLSDKHEAAQDIEQNYVRPIGVRITGAILFFAAAVVVSIVLIIIIRVAGLLAKISVVSAANSFGGLLLGVFKGVLYALVIGFIVSSVVEVSKNSLDGINTDVVEKTYLFKFFFNLFYK